MNDKILEMINKKLIKNEVVVDMILVNFISNYQKKVQNTLVITSQSFYFVSNHHNIKKMISVDKIKLITLSSFSNQMIMHCTEEDIWIQSFQNVKIIKNILKIKQKVFQDQSSLPILIEKEKSLKKHIVQESKAKKFWSGIFGKKQGDEKERISQRISFSTLEVKDKNFVIQIGKYMYKNNYVNAELLYISGISGFIFNQYDYQRQQINQLTYLFVHKQTNETLMMRKILKQSQENNKKIKRYLSNYKLEDFKQQIYYAIETVNYFQIITPYSKDQKTIEQLIVEEKVISEIDLLSIFYKMMSLIQGNFQVLHSLSPNQIIIRDKIFISSIFCINQNNYNLNYRAPQELDEALIIKIDPELVNFWKIGMLLYQIAFYCYPFPIQYLAETIIRNKKLSIKFPQSHRSTEFKNFLLQILIINPSVRGGQGWKTKIFDHKWIRQSMK